MRRSLLLGSAAFVLPLLWLEWPVARPDPVRSAPAADYAEAVARIAALSARDSMPLHEQCGTTALLHGARTPRAVVLLHGFTNCPLQFLELGQQIHDAGDNVLLPRIPHHGRADRMSTDLANLETDEVTALVAECVGIAQGLGDTVVVAGLSTSGVAATWAAQECDGVDRIVAIAPAFRPPYGPPWLRPTLARVVQRAPNVFVWWKSDQKENLDGPTQCYPRFPTRALGESYRLGEEVLSAARRNPPRAKDLAIVTTWKDEGVDNVCMKGLAASWRRHGARVQEFEFPESMHVGHDMIDPKQVGARVDVVYPVLVGLIRGEEQKPAQQ